MPNGNISSKLSSPFSVDGEPTYDEDQLEPEIGDRSKGLCEGADLLLGSKWEWSGRVEKKRCVDERARAWNGNLQAEESEFHGEG